MPGFCSTVNSWQLPASTQFARVTISSTFQALSPFRSLKQPPPTPLAQLDDGLIDLLIVRKVGRMKLLRLFPKIFSGKHIGDPAVDYRQVSEFSIKPEDKNTLNIDGEMLGSTPIRVTMMPKEIEVLV